jgi:hypothetical protein
LKCFRNIERPDVNMLFPNVRVVMSAFDKIFLGVPAVVGVIPIFLNLLPTFTVLFVVIGFYLGFTGAVGDDELKKALAALSALFALGGFALRQWMKYQRQSLMYYKEISDKIYFRNVNNNTGVFDYIIGAAEDQDFKETILAYYFLLTGGATTARDGPADRAVAGADIRRRRRIPGHRRARQAGKIRSRGARGRTGGGARARRRTRRARPPLGQSVPIRQPGEMTRPPTPGCPRSSSRSRGLPRA